MDFLLWLIAGGGEGAATTDFLLWPTSGGEDAATTDFLLCCNCCGCGGVLLTIDLRLWANEGGGAATDFLRCWSDGAGLGFFFGRI
jgi:hypothetical protein